MDASSNAPRGRRRRLRGSQLRSRGMTFRFCDDRGRHGFSWIVEEPMTRTSHALATHDGVWLVDPVDWPEAIERAASLGPPAGVIQLLDRHNRDGARTRRAARGATSRGPGVAAGDAVRGDRGQAREALAGDRTLVAASSGRSSSPTPRRRTASSRSATTGRASTRVLRLTPPRRLRAYEPEHLLVGHGEGVHGPDATLHGALPHASLGRRCVSPSGMSSHRALERSLDAAGAG